MKCRRNIAHTNIDAKECMFHYFKVFSVAAHCYFKFLIGSVIGLPIAHVASLSLELEVDG